MKNLDLIGSILIIFISIGAYLIPLVSFKNMSRNQQTGCICCVIAFFGGLITVLTTRCGNYLGVIIKLLGG